MRLKTLIAGAALLLAGCGKKDDAPAAAPTPTTVAPAAAAPSSAPLRLAITVNRSREATVSAGWAVLVEARLLLKSGTTEPLTLTNAAGPWSDALRLECKGPDGVDRASLFKPAFSSGKSIQLTPERAGQKIWTLDPVAIPEGSYRVQVVLDGAALGVALPAAGLMAATSLRVTAPPATESRAETQAKALARISAASSSGDAPKGLAVADAYLAEHPKDVSVGVVKGKILRSQGRKPEALAAFEAALRWAEERREPGGENFAIAELIQDLRRDLRAK